MCPPKKHNKSSGTAHLLPPPEMEVQELPDNEVKLIVLQMLSELQENTEKQFNNVTKPIQQQIKKFYKETENIKEKNKFWS